MFFNNAFSGMGGEVLIEAFQHRVMLPSSTRPPALMQYP
jgi:hypothetical protein